MPLTVENSAPAPGTTLPCLLPLWGTKRRRDAQPGDVLRNGSRERQAGSCPALLLPQQLRRVEQFAQNGETGVIDAGFRASEKLPKS